MSTLQTALSGTKFILAGFCNLYSSILRDAFAAIGGGCSQLFGIVIIVRMAHLVIVRRTKGKVVPMVDQSLQETE